MIRNGVSVTIFSDMAKDKGSSERFDNIEVLHVNQLFWLPLIKRHKMLRLLEESHADVILWSGRPLSCVSLSRLSNVKKPIVWMIEAGAHDVLSVLRLSRREIWNRDHIFLWNDILNALFPRRVIRRVANSPSIAKIVVPSHLMREWFLRIGVLSRKVVVIESALDEYFREFAKLAIDKGESTLRLNKRHLVVTYTGSPCTLRGSDTFVRAVRIVLAKRRVDLRCLILSRRPVDNRCPHLQREEEYLSKLVTKLGLTDVFTIIPGMLDRHRLISLIQASDVVVFPFKLLSSEIPLSVLEAMSLGKVVVTTRIRTLQEIAAGNRALLIDPGDQHALAKAVLGVVDHNKRAQEIGTAAQRFACSLPSWETTGKKTFSIIRAAAGSERQ
jgi:glycosyltransferase involved in cell wall biosynthesis